ncbi:hypothetical protein FOA43_002869 [Brettanomyces nanus]|uniref:U three protein 23 n=1 Tax=Eeniella nana TaxID=13502 RepID=A0A875S8V2_EENNA|nr:uncharacterized protein FOA43_002869 [Brettanomyces nanus]QPG75514.1 hypothetical protein FOA43_002869 [Brettanomyces nanus]
MNTCRMTFKFKPPIQVLVDADSILEAEKTKFDINKGIDRTIQMETKCFITQCCINHLYETANQPAIDIAKTMEKRRCHHDETLSSYDCIKSITNVDGQNKFRYVVVTQDEELRKELRRIPAVPLIYLNRSVMIMEPMSPATSRVVELVERKKLTGGLNDARHAGLMEDEGKKRSIGSNGSEVIAKKHKKGPRGPKEPNPLSVKKKKKVEVIEKVEKRRRRRRHGGGGNDEVSEGRGEEEPEGRGEEEPEGRGEEELQPDDVPEKVPESA